MKTKIGGYPWPFQCLVIVAALWSTPGLFAHTGSTSYSRLRVDGSQVRVQFTIGILDFHNGPKLDSDGDDEISRDELNSGIQALSEAIHGHFVLHAPEKPIAFAVEQYDFQARNVAKLDLAYTFSHAVEDLRITSTLHLITQADHRHLLAIGEGDQTRQGVVDQTNPSLFIDADGQTFLEVLWDFTKLGVEHIITGYDHLAFLAALLIATTSLRSLCEIVTSFTISHSVTLALASFNIVTLPSQMIESVIALSIAYVAIENFTGKTMVHRWKIAFLFGLVHGFGFSNILKEMELARQHLAISLFSFNLGVEIGQLFFVCAVLPIVLLAIQSKWKERFLSATSLVIMALGFYWFVERAFLT